MQKFVDALGPDTKDRDVMEKYIKFKDEKQSQKLYSFKKTLLAGNEAKDQEIWVSATFMSRVSSIEIRNPNSDEDSVFVDRKDASELILKVKNKDKNDVSYIPANAVKNGNKVDAVSQGNPKVSYEIDFKKPWYRRKANLTLQAIEFENSVNDEDNWLRDWQAQKSKEAKAQDAQIGKASLNSSNGKLGHRILSAVMAQAKNDGDNSLLKASQDALNDCAAEKSKIEEAISDLEKAVENQSQALQAKVKEIYDKITGLMEKAEKGEDVFSAVDELKKEISDWIEKTESGSENIANKAGMFATEAEKQNNLAAKAKKLKGDIDILINKVKGEFQKIKEEIAALSGAPKEAMEKLGENTSKVMLADVIFTKGYKGMVEEMKGGVTENIVNSFRINNRDAYNAQLKAYEDEIKGKTADFMADDTLGIPKNIDELAEAILKENGVKDENKQRVKENLIQAIQDSPLGMIISTYNQAKNEYNSTTDPHQKKRLANALYWIYRQWFALEGGQKGEFGTFEERARKVYSIYANSHIDLSKAKIKLTINGKEEEIALSELLDNYDVKYKDDFQKQFIDNFLQEIESGDRLQGLYHKTITSIVDEFLDNTAQYSVELSDEERTYFENLRKVLRGEKVFDIETPIKAIKKLIKDGKVELRPVYPEELEHGGVPVINVQ